MLAKHPRPVVTRVHSTPKPPLLPDAILPTLFLTDVFTARAVLLPNFPGPGRPVIRYVLSTLDNSLDQPKAVPPNRQDQFIQKLILLDDTPDSDLLAILTDACNFIKDAVAKEDGGVLVHCHLGQSRSASVVIAYLMRKDQLSYQKAFDKVKWRRNCIKPNPGFQKQLQMWAEMEYDIHDQEGKPKEIYAKWKNEQKERARRLLSLSN